MADKRIRDLQQVNKLELSDFFAQDRNGAASATKATLEDLVGLVQENAILGVANLNGSITPASPAFSPTEPVSFVAETGTYPNYGGVVVTGAAGFIVWDGTEWSAVNINVDLTGTLKATDIPDFFYPYAQDPIDENARKAAHAVKELYIKNYDPLFDYQLTLIRRNATIVGSSTNRYEVKIVKTNKGLNTIASTYVLIEDGRTEPVGYDYIDLENFSLLINWSGLPVVFELDKDPASVYVLDQRVGDLKNSPTINTIRTTVKREEQFKFQTTIVPEGAELIDTAPYTVRAALNSSGALDYDDRYLSVIEMPTFNGWIYLSGIYATDARKLAYLDASKNVVSVVTIFPDVPFQLSNENPFFSFTIKGDFDLGRPNDLRFFKKSDNVFEIKKINGLTLSSDAPAPTIDAYTKAQSDGRFEVKGTIPPPVDSYTKSSADSRFALIGSTTDSLYKFVDAGDFNFFPYSTASQNVTALQNALNGGNKTIIISQPGVYKLNATVWIDDFTEIIIGKGVILQKDAAYWNMFCNRGALTRNYNTDITIKGMHVQANGYEAEPASDQSLFGMRGMVNFFYIKNLVIEDFKCLDIGVVNWPLHICTFYNFSIDGIELAGEKDGIHLGRGKKFSIRNYKSSCYDDTIGFNCFDYPVSNPEIGDIEDGVVENVEWTHNPAWGTYGGRVFNFLVGAVRSWATGLSIKNGDAFNHNGSTYIALTNYDGTLITSTTEPTVFSFEANQPTPEGITWRLQRKSTTTSANVINVRVNNTVINSPQMELICRLGAGDDGVFSRTIHPTISAADYPTIDIQMDGIRSKRGYFLVEEKLGHKILISGFRGKNANEVVINSANTAKKGYWNIKNSDLTGILGGFTFGNNADIRFKDNIQNTIVSLNCGGSRLNGDLNTDIDPAGLGAQKGDTIKINGVVKIYNGSAWIDQN